MKNSTAKNSAAVDKLDAHIKGIGKSRCGWAKEHGYPVPVITRFLKRERGVEHDTIAKIIDDCGGALDWEDFRQPSKTQDSVETPGALCAESAS